MSEQLRFLIAFSSPKRSASVVTVAAKYALVTKAELILLRVLPDAEKVGVVAQLIATDRPHETAQKQLNFVHNKLTEKGLSVRSELRIGEVGPGLATAAEEFKVDLLFIGTMNLHEKPRFYMARDPIVHYLVNNCPTSLFLVREDDASAQPPLYTAMQED